MRRHWLWLSPVVVLAALALVLAFGGGGRAGSATGCTFVNGHLVGLHVADDGTTVGRMVGGISGDYRYVVGDLGPSYDPPVVFGAGDTTITTSSGTLTWHEDSALDQWNEDAYSTAVLARVTGGTGMWEGAHGHVIMSGYFHISTMTGEFDYRGEVCSG